MAGEPLWQETLDAEGRPKWQETLDQGADGPTPPEPPTIDALTPQLSPRTISGRAQPGAIVQAIINGLPAGMYLADSYGDWAFVFAAAPGNYGLEVRQIVDSIASEYTDIVVFALVPDEPLPLNRGAGRHQKDEFEYPLPMGEEPARLAVPFRRPAAWPGEKG